MIWGIAHDPCRATDRSPLGAVPFGTPVHVMLRVSNDVRADIETVDAVVRDGDTGWYVPMVPEGAGFTCTLEFPLHPHVAFYHFELQLCSGEKILCVPRSDGKSTAGELVIEPDEDIRGFQVSLYEPSFTTPEWLCGAVMYQVFPDRFSRGTAGVRREGVAYHKRMERPVHMRKKWDSLPAWTKRKAYDPCEFYGGTIEGLCEKLPYIASLGVEVLYLNPVFEARSNHRYDTADYEHIDPLLGTDEDFSRLCDKAAELGISVLLDAVLSHTGADSRYFNAYGTYDTLGAMQGAQSPYRHWYDFDEKEDTIAYRCWWGDPSLPEVDELDESWQRYIFGDIDGVPAGLEGEGENPSGGILPKWLCAGARGYRLDVADELPDAALQRLRQAVKHCNPDAAIIGEVWEDATTKESYGMSRTYALGLSLDSVMNYPLREALIDFATGFCDAFQLATFLKLQQSNYPRPLYRCLMNLLSSHDVERVRTVLSLGGSVKNMSRFEQFKLVSGITSEQDEKGAALQRMIAKLMYALPGTPCLYYGDERGMQGGGDPFCRAPFPWGGGNADRTEDVRQDCGEDLTDFYREIGTIRKGSDALRKGDMRCEAFGADTLCVLRVSSSGEAVLAVANRSESEQRIAVDLNGLDMEAASMPSTGLQGLESIEGNIATLVVPACTTSYVHVADAK